MTLREAKGHRAQKCKNDKFGIIKIKNFYCLKDIAEKMKRQNLEWEKIFTALISDKELVSRLHKCLIQITKKKTTNR